MMSKIRDIENSTDLMAGGKMMESRITSEMKSISVTQPCHATGSLQPKPYRLAGNQYFLPLSSFI